MPYYIQRLVWGYNQQLARYIAQWVFSNNTLKKAEILFLLQIFRFIIKSRGQNKMLNMLVGRDISVKDSIKLLLLCISFPIISSLWFRHPKDMPLDMPLIVVIQHKHFSIKHTDQTYLVCYLYLLKALSGLCLIAKQNFTPWRYD